MPTMVNLGSEIIRINPAKNTIESSTNNGRFWVTRSTQSSVGTFIDLLPYGNELLAATSKGVYASSNQGRFWVQRCTGSSYGDFQSLMDGGKELLAQTTKGLYVSTNSGRFWVKRR